MQQLNVYGASLSMMANNTNSWKGTITGTANMFQAKVPITVLISFSTTKFTGTYTYTINSIAFTAEMDYSDSVITVDGSIAYLYSTIKARHILTLNKYQYNSNCAVPSTGTANVGILPSVFLFITYI